MTVKIKTFKLRNARCMTQQQLAKRASLSKTTISNLESGQQTKIELETIAKLCRALDCTPSELFDLGGTHLFEKQKEVLDTFIGTLEYDKPFQPGLLDEEFADMINFRKRNSKL